MSIDNLGTLEYVDVRQVWSNEQTEFTPWLAENLGRLGEVIRLDLELIDTEMAIGNYRADIVGRVANDGTRVLIENQLGDADLQHLGQVLAYLAGLDAKVVVWVATDFRSELLAAIRWLNDHTPTPYEFFAVQIRLARIGNSPPAPVFDLMERPNEWERAVQKRVGQRENNEFDEMRREFWEHYDQLCDDEDDVDISEGAWSHVTWDAGDGLRVCTGLWQRGVGVWIQLDWRDEETMSLMEACHEVISEKLPNDEVHPLQYRNQWCKSILRIDVRERDNWNTMVDWLEERRKVYLSVLEEGTPEAPGVH